MASSAESDDSPVVDTVPAESTIPEAAPVRRSTPIVVPPRARPERHRRSTLVSAIPAMLAASMRGPKAEGGPEGGRPEGRGPEGRGPEGRGKEPTTPRSSPSEGVPVAANTAQTTSRLSDQEQADLLGDGSPEYVVEINGAKPKT